MTEHSTCRIKLNTWPKIPGGANRNKSNVLTTKSCYCCAEVSHQVKQCKLRNGLCHICGKIDHKAKACRFKRKMKKNVKVHNVQMSEDDREPEKYILYSIRGIGKALPATEGLCKMQGKPVIFEVDSGISYTIMPVNSFDKIKKYLPPLELINIKLQSYTEHAIDISGVTQVNVIY